MTDSQSSVLSPLAAQKVLGTANSTTRKMFELADAMRSWCNPAGEDVRQAEFRLDLFEAAMQGYASEADWTEAERASIGPGIERICLELAARFARDALEESYFGFDPTIGRGEHNLLRARGQAALAASVRRQRSAIEAVLTGS